MLFVSIGFRIFMNIRAPHAEHEEGNDAINAGISGNFLPPLAAGAGRETGGFISPSRCLEQKPPPL